MNPAIAHTRGILAMLHPSRPSAGRAWGSLAFGFLGLVLAGRYLDHVEIGDRLFAAMWLLFASAGLSGLRQACWSPRTGTLAPLPIGRVYRLFVEAAAYLGLVLAIALPLYIGQTMLGLRWRSVLAPVPDTAGIYLLTELAWLGAATMLLLPLLVATAPGEARQGPLAMLRLLLPWLPMGVAAPAGWLDDPRGLWLTVAAMWATTGLLLALRRTGWEDWWPQLPDLSRRKDPQRPGLAHPARVDADFRDGLRHGLGWGLGLCALAWPLLALSSRGIVDERWQIAAALAIAFSFLVATQLAMRIPVEAHLPNWTPETLPWTLLPIPRGTMQGRIHRSQALAWLVLAPLQLLAMVLVSQGMAGNSLGLVGVDFCLAMLLPTMPIVMLWEGRFASSPSPAGPLPRVAFVVLAALTVMLTLVGGFWLVDQLPIILNEAPMGWVEACSRTGAIAGPPALLGLAWLAAGRLIIQRDIARQREG